MKVLVEIDSRTSGGFAFQWFYGYNAKIQAEKFCEIVNNLNHVRLRAFITREITE